LALKEHDDKQLYIARQNLSDLRNVYAVITDILHKNISKVILVPFVIRQLQLNVIRRFVHLKVTMALAYINQFFVVHAPRHIVLDVARHPRYIIGTSIPDTALSYRDRFKYIKPVSCCAYNGPRNLGVPMDLFYLLLSLMNEEQLGWKVLSIFRSVVHCPSLLVVLFNSEIPKCHLIVRSGCSKNRILCRVPFD
jgi:hypothetical protein